MWLLFLSWASWTILWAGDVDSAVRTLLIALPLIALVVLASIVPVEGADLDALRVAIIISGVMVGGYALYLLLSGAVLPTHGVSRRFAIASTSQPTDPNILAASLLLPLALSIERMVFGGVRWWSNRAWVCFGVTGTFLIALAIVMTGSRGGLIAGILVVVLTLYACGVEGGRERVWRIVTSAAAVVLATAFLSTASSLVSPGGGILSDLWSSPPVRRILENRAESSGRVEIWAVGLTACETHCAWGAGIGNFAETFSNFYASSGLLNDVGSERPAHNLLLNLIVETGLVGLTLFLLALTAEWRSLSQPALSRLAPSLKPALLALLVANVFLSAVWFKYFWLLFLLIRVTEGAVLGRPAAQRDRLAATSPVGFARI
jgi:O-antigen ligase